MSFPQYNVWCERRLSYSLLGLDGEGEDSVGATALSVHGGGRNSSVHPSSPQYLDHQQPLTWALCTYIYRKFSLSFHLKYKDLGRVFVHLCREYG